MAKGTRTKAANNSLPVAETENKSKQSTEVEQPIPNPTPVSETVVGLAEEHAETKDFTTEEVLDVLKKQGITEAEITGLDDNLKDKPLQSFKGIVADYSNDDKIQKPDDPKKEAIAIPTPGRIVTFFPENGGSTSWPAMVTRAADDGILSLQVFTESFVAPHYGVPHKGIKNETHEDGHWDWPARS